MVRGKTLSGAMGGKIDFVGSYWNFFLLYFCKGKEHIKNLMDRLFNPSLNVSRETIGG